MGLHLGFHLCPFVNTFTVDIPYADLAMQKQITALQIWYIQWRVQINAANSINLIITKKRTQPDRELKIFNTNIPNVKSAKYLGLTLDRSPA
ncbi:hypothetical protein PR048_002037 [Dryococelus australis]|uniref:Uncharacterized protein n=1 Tax=Dryococelus australis TaxID=614101 RepID=A0ABQ9IJU1_9NEOP|nr:hypothetical protein PR048_002037 [Dryococelus australis]